MAGNINIYIYIPSDINDKKFIVPLHFVKTIYIGCLNMFICIFCLMVMNNVALKVKRLRERSLTLGGIERNICTLKNTFNKKKMNEEMNARSHKYDE